MEQIEVNIDPQDVINALSSQRNAAMDEIARQAAIIVSLHKKLEDREKPVPSGDFSGVPIPLAPSVESPSQP